jgi:hypothetical protein
MRPGKERRSLGGFRRGGEDRFLVFLHDGNSQEATGPVTVLHERPTARPPVWGTAQEKGAEVFSGRIDRMAARKSAGWNLLTT